MRVENLDHLDRKRLREPSHVRSRRHAAAHQRSSLALDRLLPRGGLSSRGVKPATDARASALEGGRAKFYGRSVLVATRSQLTAALTLIELDGIARRLILLPPDVPSAQELLIVLG